MYAVRDYHDQPLQFINTIYFHIKTKGDRHYDTVEIILGLLTFLKPVISIIMNLLFPLYMISAMDNIMQKILQIHTPEINSFLSALEEFAAKCTDKTLSVEKSSKNKPKEYSPINENNMYIITFESNTHNDYVQKLSKMEQQEISNIQYYFNSDQKKIYEVHEIQLRDKSKSELNFFPVIIVNILFCLALCIIHSISIAWFFQYSNEVLTVNYIVILDTLFSVIFLLYVLLYYLYILYEQCKNKDIKLYQRDDHIIVLQCPVTVAAQLVALNLTYIVSYYLPYMFLAFIFDPLLTITTYFVLGLNVLCVYLWLSNLPIKIKENEQQNKQENKQECIKEINKKRIVTSLLVIIVIYTSYVFKLVLRLGSFDDIKVVQSLLLPLVIAFIVLLIIKPTYKKIKQAVDYDNSKYIH